MALQENQGGRALRVRADRMPELRIGATARYVALAATKHETHDTVTQGH